MLIRFQRSIVAILLFLPVSVFAAATDTDFMAVSFSYFLDIYHIILFIFAPGVAAVAILVFLWGLAKFVLAAGDEKEHEGGRRLMVWGAIAISVMVSTAGLVRLLASAFGIEGPFVRFGAGGGPFDISANTFLEIITLDIVPTLNYLIGILLGVAIVVFAAAVVKFLYALVQGDEKSISVGKRVLVWGIIALTAMFSWWAIINLVSSALGVQSWDPSDPSTFIPQFRFQSDPVAPSGGIQF